MPAATPALIERVDPYWVIEQIMDALSRAVVGQPDRFLAEQQQRRRGKVVVSIGTAPGRLSIATTV